MEEPGDKKDQPTHEGEQPLIEEQQKLIDILTNAPKEGGVSLGEKIMKTITSDYNQSPEEPLPSADSEESSNSSE